MAIEYEIDITTQGNELNIETSPNELNITSERIELTLSRTGAQGPGGAATATPFDPNGQFTMGEITFTSDFVFYTAVRDIAADSDVSVLNTDDFRPLITIDDAVIAQAIAEYLANNPLEVVSVASSTPMEVPVLQFVLAGTDLYLATTSHSNVTTSTDFTAAGWYHVNGTGVERVATDPTSPSKGEIWFNTTTNILKYYDGTNTQTVQIDIDATLVLDTAAANTIEIAPYSNNGGAAVREGAALIVQTEDGVEISAGSSAHTHTGPEQLFNDFKIGLNKSVVILPYDEEQEYVVGDLVYYDDGGEDLYRRIGNNPTTGVVPTTAADWTRITVDNGNDVLYNSSPAITAKANRTDVSILRWEQGISFPADQWVLFSNVIYRNNSGAAKSGQVIPSADPDWVEVELGSDLPIYNSGGEVEATPSRLVFTGDGVTVIADSNDAVTIDIPGGADIAAYSSTATYVLNNFVYNPVNGIIYRSLGNNAAGSSLVNPMLWQSLGGATQFAPIPVTAENLTSISIPDDTVGAELQLSSNNVETGLGVPNDNTRIFGINGINVTAHGTEDIIVVDGSGISPGTGIPRFAGRTAWFESLTAPTGTTITVVDNEIEYDQGQQVTDSGEDTDGDPVFDSANNRTIFPVEGHTFVAGDIISPSSTGTPSFTILEAAPADDAELVAVTGDATASWPDGAEVYVITSGVTTITFDDFIHPVTSAIDQDVDAILEASGYVLSNQFFIDSRDRFYFIASTGGHFHLAEQPVELGDLSDVELGTPVVGDIIDYHPNDGTITEANTWRRSSRLTSLEVEVANLSKEIGTTFENVDAHAIALRTALRSVSTSLGQQTTTNSDINNPEYIFDSAHQLVWYTRLVATSDTSIADQLAALEAGAVNGREIALSTAVITDGNINLPATFHFKMQSVTRRPPTADVYQIRAVLIDPTRNDAFRTAFGITGPDPFHYPNLVHIATNNVMFDHIEAIQFGAEIVIPTGLYQVPGDISLTGTIITFDTPDATGGGVTDDSWYWRTSDTINTITVPASWQAAVDNGQQLLVDAKAADVTALSAIASALGTDRQNPGLLTVRQADGGSAIINAYVNTTTATNDLRIIPTAILYFTGTPVGTGAVSISQTSIVNDAAEPVTLSFGEGLTTTTNASGVTTLNAAAENIPSGTQFPPVADHTPGDLFILTAGHTQPADDDLIYVGLYVLVQNTPTNEWVHLTEYKTTEVELNYPGGSENVTLYGNKGVEDVAQDVLDTAALIYNNMNQQLALKQNVINDWAVSTAYLVGDEVFTPLGAETLMWRCDVAHTSSSTTGDGTGTSRPRFNVDNTNWTVIGFNDIHTWTSTFAYNVGDLVTYVDTDNISNSGIYQCILGNASNSPPNDTYWFLLTGINESNAPAVRATLNVADGADRTTVSYTAAGGAPTEIVPAFSPDTITFSAAQVAVAGSLPADFTVVDTRRYSIIVVSNQYIGTFVVPGTAVSFVAGVWVFDVTGDDVTASPALPTTGTSTAANNSITVDEIPEGGGTFVVTGQINITGNAVSYNTITDTFTFTQGSGSSNQQFIYALLLTNGFLLPENSAMSTATRDAYTDTAGAYGVAGTVYWFDNTDNSWYSVSTGGTALVSFPA